MHTGKIALVVAVTALFVAAVACDPSNPFLRFSQNRMIRVLFGGNATELKEHTEAEIEASALCQLCYSRYNYTLRNP